MRLKREEEEKSKKVEEEIRRKDDHKIKMVDERKTVVMENQRNTAEVEKNIEKESVQNGTAGNKKEKTNVALKFEETRINNNNGNEKETLEMELLGKGVLKIEELERAKLRNQDEKKQRRDREEQKLIMWEKNRQEEKAEKKKREEAREVARKL